MQIILFTSFDRISRQAECMQRNLPPDYLYLVPTKRKINFICDSLLKNQGKRWIPSIYTIGALACELYSKLSGKKRLINEFTQQLIINCILEDSEHKWEFFKKDALTPGLYRAVLQFINKVKIYHPHNLPDAILKYRTPQVLQPKDHDLIRLYEKYEDLLAQKNLIDSGGLMYEVIGLLGNDYPTCNLLSAPNRLIIDGFYCFNPLEEKFISALCKNFKETLVLMDQKDQVDNILDKYLTFWKKLAYQTKSDLQIINQPDDFNTDLSSSTSNTAAGFIGFGLDTTHSVAVLCSSKLEIRQAFNRKQEVTEIARGIRRIINRHPDTKLSDIYVVFADMNTYAPLAQEVFPSYALAYEITKGSQLHTSAATKIVLKMLDIVIGGYRSNDWSALFSSGLVDYSCYIDDKGWGEFLGQLDIPANIVNRLSALSYEGRNNFDMPFVDKLLRCANLSGGRSWPDDWLKPLLNLLNKQKIPDIKAYRQLYILKKLWDEFDALPALLTAGEFADGIRHLLKRFGVFENILKLPAALHNYSKRHRRLIIKKQISAFNKLNSILGQFDSVFELVYRSKAKLPVSKWRLLFLNNLKNEEYFVTDYQEDRIQLVETLELRGLSFGYLFWGGLVEDEFPRPEPRSFFYPIRGRKKLFDTLGRLDEDSYLFSYVFKNTYNKITLSYPVSQGGKTLLASPFIEELKQSIQIKETKPADFSQCYTKNELLCRIVTSWQNNKLAINLLKALKKADRTAYKKSLHILYLDIIRQSENDFCAYDGIITLPHNLERIQQLNPEAYYAVTGIEKYSLCPISYFFKTILGLKPADELIEAFKPQDRGYLLHRILELFYKKRITEYHNTKIIPENLEQARKDMLEIASTVLKEDNSDYDNLFWENEKQSWTAESGLLQSFLDYEANCPDKLRPAYTELSFGRRGALPAFRLNEINIEGRIDRVDISDDGGAAVIYDYKFGNVPSNVLIKQGVSFQLPVYMLALYDFLKHKGHKICAGGYYQVKSSQLIKKTGYLGIENIKVSSKNKLVQTISSTGIGQGGGDKILCSRQQTYGFLSNEEFEQQLNRVKSNLIYIHKLINKGRFNLPLTDEKNLPCGFCDYAYICRVDILRQNKLYYNLCDDEYYKPIR